MKTIGYMFGAALALSAAAPALAGPTGEGWTGEAQAVPFAAVTGGVEQAGLSKQDTSSAAGLYRGTDAGNEIFLQLFAEGYHVVMVKGPMAVVLGNIASDGSTITFQDINASGCDSGVVGSYTYEVDAAGISFTLNGDDCGPRAQALGGKTFARYEPGAELEAANPQ